MKMTVSELFEWGYGPKAECKLATAPTAMKGIANDMELIEERLEGRPEKTGTVGVPSQAIPAVMPVESQLIIVNGVNCPFCSSNQFEDAGSGWRCSNCKRLAWIWTVDGGIVRADFEGVNLSWSLEK